MGWFFGDQVAVSYRCQPEDPGLPAPSVVIDGEVVARGRIPAEEIVRYIEKLGTSRLDRN